METIQVEIFGQMYTLKGGTNPGRVRDLAAFVNARMKEVQRGTGTSDGYRVAILTALNIADELFRIRHQQEIIQNSAQQSLGRLIAMTDKGEEVEES